MEKEKEKRKRKKYWKKGGKRLWNKENLGKKREDRKKRKLFCILLIKKDIIYLKKDFIYYLKILLNFL